MFFFFSLSLFFPFFILPSFLFSLDASFSPFLLPILLSCLCFLPFFPLSKLPSFFVSLFYTVWLFFLYNMSALAELDLWFQLILLRWALCYMWVHAHLCACTLSHTHTRTPCFMLGTPIYFLSLLELLLTLFYGPSHILGNCVWI